MLTKCVLVIVLCLGFLDLDVSAKKNRKTIQQRNNIKKDEKIMDVSDLSVYYDIATNETIKKMMPRPWYKPGWRLRLPFTGASPCNCQGVRCRCCVGVRVQTVNFDRQTCITLEYNATESLIDMEVQMNNDSVMRNTYSARNPPPYCVPIPVPYLPPGLVDMCVRLFDISVVDQMLHACMDIDTRIDKAPVLVLHFDCMDLGTGGVGISKPGGSNNQTSVSGSSTPEPAQADSDIYDPVIEVANLTPVMQAVSNMTRTYI